MIVTVKRIRQGKDSTLSEIWIDDLFCCYGLEDAIREEKIWGETAIPEGNFNLRLRKLGGMHARYHRLFPKLHNGMLELVGVPNFKYIYLHIGNNIGDTAGCILVGDSFVFDDDGDYELRNSKTAFKRLYKLLVDAVTRGGVVVEVTNQIDLEIWNKASYFS